MDITFFDPASFACGVGAMAAVVGSTKVKYLFKRKNKALLGHGQNLALNSPLKSLSELVDNAHNHYSQLFAEYQPKVEEREVLADEFNHNLITAFPQSTRSLGKLDSRILLNNILTLMNELKNTNIQRSRYNELTKELDDKFVELEKNLNSDSLIITQKNNTLRNSIAYREHFPKRKTAQSARFEAAKDRWSKAQEIFEPVYLERVPVSALNTEKAYDNLMAFNPSLTYGAADDRNYDAALKKFETEMRRFENHLHRVFNFSEKAIREAHKAKVKLRNAYNPGNVATLKASSVKALESLMEAEKASYDEGNPQEKYKEITKPYREYEVAFRAKVAQRRMGR